jgi:hypothetical protein
MQLPLYIYFLILSAIVGISVYFQRPAPLYMKLFPFFLIITIAVEFVGMWMFREYGSNMALYNFYIVVNFCFFQFVLRDIISDPIFKRISLYAILLYGLLAFANIFYGQGLNVWNSVSYAMGSLLVVAFCIYYFFELFKRPKSTKLTKEPAFWIVSGLLFFYCCSFPFLGLNNIVQTLPVVILLNLKFILSVLNVLLYLLFTIAFLCRFRLKRPAV